MAIGIERADLSAWLASCGIDVEHARKVIIEAEVGCITKVYVTQFGSDKMFKVQPPDLTDAKVVVTNDTSDPKVSSITSGGWVEFDKGEGVE